MGDRADDWLRQADSDLRLARGALGLASYEWCCFAAQQAAEKAIKGLFLRIGAEAWGHSVTVLAESLRQSRPVDEALIDAARRLDKHYIPTRYPNGFDSGAPADYYTRDEAERALRDGQSIVDFCRSEMGKPRGG